MRNGNKYLNATILKSDSFLICYRLQPLLNLRKEFYCAYSNIFGIFTIATIINNVISLPIPKLDVSETNWAVFLLCFRIAIEEKRL